MPDINLPMPINEAIAPEQPANMEEILGTSAPTPPDAPVPNDICHPKREIGTAPVPVSPPVISLFGRQNLSGAEPVQPEAALEEEIEEELIIEDFTIDGICGVY